MSALDQARSDFYAGNYPSALDNVNAALKDVLAMPDVKARLLDLGIEAKWSTPQEIQDLVDYVRYPDIPGQTRPHL